MNHDKGIYTGQNNGPYGHRMNLSMNGQLSANIIQPKAKFEANVHIQSILLIKIKEKTKFEFGSYLTVHIDHYSYF